MADTDSLASLLGTVATITTIGQFLSGTFTVRQVIKQGACGDISPFPFLVGTVTCALWLAYGRMRDDSMIVWCNLIGTVISSVYVLIFTRYVSNKEEFLRQIVLATTLLAAALAYCSFGNDSEQGLETLGQICVLVTLFCCASPLVGLKQVMKTKSTDSLPFPLIFSTFLVCILWWIYGVLTSDVYTQVTNSICTVISLLQLSLFLIYPSASSKADKKKKKF